MKRYTAKLASEVVTVPYLLALICSLFTIHAAHAQDDCTPAPSGMVDWWPGDGFAIDVAGTNNGTLQNGAGYMAGEVGQGFSFGATNAYVLLPNNFFPFPISGTTNQPFTFEVWFETKSGGVIFGQQNGPAYGSVSSFVPGLYVGTDGKFRAELFWSGSENTLMTSATTVTNGIFHHAAVSYNGTNSILYLDGVSIATNSQNQTAYAATYYYQFGVGDTSGWPGGNGGWYQFGGVIDEPTLYSRALASNEIAAIYAAGSSGKCYTNTPLPVFVQNPVSQTDYVANAFSLYGAAMGTPRPQYQWLTNGVPVAGATNATLIFSNPTANQSGVYALVASNIFGSTTSLVANVSIILPSFLTGIEGFESGLGDWSVNNGLWQVGVPTAGPGKAYDGTNCAGTGLTGNVPTYVGSSLISPVFVVPAAGDYPRLRWWQWFHLGNSYSGTDVGDFEISTNGGASWQTLLSIGGEGASSGGWTEPSVDLSAYAGQSVQIAFYYQTGNEGNGGGPGWFVDDVTLVTGAPVTLTPNVPVGFESGLGDWSVNNGLWQVGVPTAGPGKAYDGTNCAGTGLTGNVPTYVGSSLISPVFVVPAAGDYPRLRWWQWFHLGNSYSGTDVGDFEISTNGGASWQTLLSIGGEGASSGGWTEPSVDLSAYAGQSVQIAFYYQTGNEGNGGGPGWFVDDVTLVTGAPVTLTPNVPVGFESGLGDWSVNNGLWQVGVPTAGPGKAYDGTNCAGTGLTGNVPTYVGSSLISPVFVVPAAGDYPRLRWWQWFHLGNSYSGTDVGDFEISTNGGASWQTLLSIGGEGASSGGWTEPSVDLSAYAGQSVQIAFYYQTGNEGNGGGPGWFVDDVTLVTGAPVTLTPNVPVGFESGLGDWSVNNGLWQVGVPTAGPGKAYDGTNCAGTGLTGNVPTYVGSSLISPVFVVPAAGDYPRLRWWQWFHLGNSYSGTDVGDFEISTNGGASWQTLLSIGGEGASSGGWTEPSVDLSAYAGQSVQIAFYYQTGNEGNGGGPGWFVDDVTLVTGAPVTLTPNVPVGFESGLGDWSVNNGLWQVGVPTAGPGKAYDGTNCAGTGLTGNVPTYVGSSLISPVFVVPAAGDYPRLRWWQWFHLGNSYSGTDVGDFEISTNGGASWQTLLSIGGEGASSGGWTEPSVDLSAYAGQSVQIAFYYQTGNEGNGGGPGWFVDDVTLVTGAPVTLTPNVPVGFESGLGDWSVNNGLWQVGVPTAGPGKAYDGTNCAGTGLTGNVPTYVGSSLISPVFVVPAAGDYPRLRWWQWFHLGNSYSGTDVGDFEISTNGGASWQTLLSIGGEGASSGGWTEPSVDLSAYAGQSVQIAFYYQTGNEGNGGGPGWFVDDVTLVTGAPVTLTPNVPVGFESGLGDWSVNNGLWQVGVPTAGPGKAYDGTNCAGTGLTGNVPTYVGSSLISPVFVVPAAGDYPRLRWWQWFHLGNSYSGTDVGDFEISTNGGASWQTLLSIGGEGASSGGWTEPSVDLSAYAGQSVQIAFYYQTGNEGNGGGPGWFVDDVTLVTGAGLQIVLMTPISSPQLNGTILPLSTMQIQDQGTTIFNWAAPITVIATSSSGGTLQGTKSVSINLSTGLATFTNLYYTLANSNIAQSVTIIFNSDSLTSATNPPIMIDIPISGFSISSSNTQVQVDPTSDDGLYSWTVNGTDVSYQHWYWLRIGSNAPQFSLDALSEPYGLYRSPTNTTVNYLGQGLSATLAFSLNGGANGNTVSTVAESLTILNTTNTTVNLHVFEYSDYDLSDDPPMDTLSFPSVNKAVQQGNGLTLTETIGTPMPNYYEGSWYAVILDGLSGNSPITLSDSIIPNEPGDQTFAHEWDTNLAAGQTVVISLTNSITGSVSTTPIFLSVALAGNNIVISWPTNSPADFQLESTTNLSASSSWTTVSSPWVINGNVYQVILPLLPGAQYFRLQQLQE